VASQNDTPEFDVQDISTRTGLSVLQIMWQRKSLVVLGIMLGLVLGLLYYAQKQPVYQSQASVLIVKKSPNEPFDVSGRGDSRMLVMDDYISTQQTIVRSWKVLNAAIKLPKIKDLKIFTSDSEFDRVWDIQQQLVVARDNREGGAPSNILNLSFKGTVPDDCRLILEGIIESYQSFLDATFQNFSDRHVKLITEAKDQLEGKANKAQQEYAKFRLQSPFTIVAKTSTGGTLITERIGKYEMKKSELQIEREQKADQLARIERALKEGGPEEGNKRALVMIRQLGVKLPIYNDMPKFQDMLLQLTMNRRELLQQLGERHPVIMQLDAKIAEIKRFTGQSGEPGTGSMSNPDDAQSYIVAMKEEIDALSTNMLALENLIEAQTNEARKMNEYEVKEEMLRTQKDQTQKMFDILTNQLEKIDVVRGFGGYDAQQIAPPSLARKVAPNAVTVFPLAGIAGLVAGLCLAYLAELSDKSFRTPAEIRRRLGLPVIGHIPYYAPDEKAAKQLAAGEPVVDPMICTHYTSNSVSSEAFRSVRTALYFNTHGVGHQVIQVTSPNVSDGKTTLAANLAVSIAQSGKRSIMIDADCRRPRIHKVFNVAADTGLATVIAGQTDLASAIRPTAIPNLSVLPCGPRPANPAELLTSPRFKEMLDIIRSQYDFVILDTPPLLVVTDPCVVAPRVDGVILAIRVTKNGRPFAERSKEILASLGANVLGVVVNGLGSPAGGKYGYGYDQYQYGYGYTYRYSYTYTDEYTDDKAASYYNTEPTGAAPPSAPLEGQQQQ
jgi:capsular exopolysaccharide synthesis family protein